MLEIPASSNPVHRVRPTAFSSGRAIKVLNLVSANADIERIELELRKDPVLTLQLLQYIHSAGFGLASPVRSYRQAVLVVGYKPLHRWLSLLMNVEREPATIDLGFNAAVHGRFLENLGREHLERSNPDDLFMTGALSLLDRICDHPMAGLLDTVTLPEDICDALLSRAGPYGPLLQLAEAIEQNNTREVKLRIEELLLEPNATAATHRAAVQWVAQLGIGP